METIHVAVLKAMGMLDDDGKIRGELPTIWIRAFYTCARCGHHYERDRHENPTGAASCDYCSEANSPDSFHQWQVIHGSPLVRMAELAATLGMDEHGEHWEAWTKRSTRF